MPRYCYVCDKCKVGIEVVRAVRNRNRRPSCVACGVRMGRDFLSEGTNTDTNDYAREILSESMGVSPSQVSEHRRLHPNIPMTDTGEIIVRSGSEERRIVRELAKTFGRR